jgi:proprotein convertase subtilisin/kexin type 5
VIYYKDIYNKTCDISCPDGQFISTLYPNFCLPCNIKCLRCTNNATYCSKCQVGYYLYVDSQLCTRQCPLGYFNDPILTPNNYLCTKCTPGCILCTGPTLNNCQTCTNVTTAGITTIYYKHQSINSCVTRCTGGYYGYGIINLCVPCSGGCTSC